MLDSKYCYPESEVLKNKLNIRDGKELFEVEKRLTLLRIQELLEKPIKGKYDFKHLMDIHRYIFQDVYEWAGKVRTVEIGKGNLFCTTACISEYGRSIFNKYYSQCYAAKDNKEDFVRVFSENYGDLNALHPFREGNGRAQREFARNVCFKCGYSFNLSNTSHNEMLQASILSFEKGESSGFIKIFSNAVTPLEEMHKNNNSIGILTSDDLIIGYSGENYYNGYDVHNESDKYDKIYEAKINIMDAEKIISDTQTDLKVGRQQFDNDKKTAKKSPKKQRKRGIR